MLLPERDADPGAGRPDADLRAVPPGRFQFLDVDKDIPIKNFVTENGLRFKAGRGFYEWREGRITTTLTPDLGKAFDPEDYPEAALVRAQFTLKTTYLSFSTPTSLKAISRSLFEREQRKAEAAWKSAQDEIVTLLRSEFQKLVSHMADRLAPAEPDVLPGQVHRGAAELGHADLEGDAGAERRLLEDQGLGVAGQRRPRLARLRPRFPVGRQAEELLGEEALDVVVDAEAPLVQDHLDLRGHLLLLEDQPVHALGLEAGHQLELARRHGADQAEVGASYEEGLSVTVRMGELESVERQRDLVRASRHGVWFGAGCGGAAALGAETSRTLPPSRLAVIPRAISWSRSPEAPPL